MFDKKNQVEERDIKSVLSAICIQLPCFNAIPIFKLIKRQKKQLKGNNIQQLATAKNKNPD